MADRHAGLFDGAEYWRQGWLETKADRSGLEGEARGLLTGAPAQEMVVRAKPHGAIGVELEALPPAVEPERQVDVGFLRRHAIPGAAPGLLGHFGHAVVEGLAARGLLGGGHGGIITRIVARQDSRAGVGNEQRALSKVVHREREDRLAVPHGDQRAVQGIRVGVGYRAQPQAGAVGRGWFQLFECAIEHLEAGLVGGGGLPDQIDDARLQGRIREGLDALNLRQRSLGRHPELERVPEGGGIVVNVRKLFGIHRAEGERDGIAIGFGFCIRCAPPVGVPVAKFHPADVAAARLAVLREMLVRPAAGPVIQVHALWGRGAVFEMHDHLVNLPRVLPHHAAALRQRQAKGRGIKLGGSKWQAEGNGGESNQPYAGTEMQGSGL